MSQRSLEEYEVGGSDVARSSSGLRLATDRRSARYLVAPVQWGWRDDRRSSSTSRKPRVVTNPAFEPFFSIDALVTSVVACDSSDTFAGSPPCVASPRGAPL